MKNNLLVPKFFGVITISAVMIIGVYVLILDLPKTKDERSNLSAETSINKDDSTDNQSNNTSVEDKDAESSDSTPTPPSIPNNSPTSPPATSTPTTPTNPTPPTTPTFSYKNGSYTSSNSYSVPGNKSNILTATITITNDTITSISTSSINDAGSQQYNDDFKAEISDAVIGKKISPLSVGVLGGASLTSDAFNVILSQIRNLAKNS